MTDPGKGFFRAGQRAEKLCETISTDSTYDGLYNYYDAETNSIVVVLSYVAEATGTLGTLVAELYLP